MRLEGLEESMSGRAGESGGANHGGMRVGTMFDRVEDRDRSVEHAHIGLGDLARSSGVW